jgi:hypothetical protein
MTCALLANATLFGASRPSMILPFLCEITPSVLSVILYRLHLQNFATFEEKCFEAIQRCVNRRLLTKDDHVMVMTRSLAGTSFSLF